MEKEDLIISLIQQDLKHHQLLGGLQRLGLEGGGKYCLGVLEMVCQLMHVPEGKVRDRWSFLYVSYMSEAPGYEVTERGESLRALAEVCYYRLKAVLNPG